jgi:hypothetical protein
MVKVIPAAKTTASAANTHPNVFPSLFILETSCGRSRRQAVATHDFRQLCSVGRTTGRRVDYLGRLAEILRPYRRWRDHAERFHVMDSIVIEPVNGTARNA